jgi:hypothetical protein
VYAYTIIVTFIRPEYLGRCIDASGDRDYVEDTGSLDSGLHKDANGNGNAEPTS